MNNNLLKNIAIWLLIGFLVFLIVDFYKSNEATGKVSPISYSNFLSEIKYHANVTYERRREKHSD